jgi:very-short-patch-repair endonuclease
VALRKGSVIGVDAGDLGVPRGEVAAAIMDKNPVGDVAATLSSEIVDRHRMTARIVIDLDDLRRRYEAGASVKQLAEHFGCSRRPIAQRLEDMGITPRDRSEAMYLRMANTSFEDRQKLVKNANSVARERVHSEQEKIKRALAVYSSKRNVSPYEVDVIEALEAHGIVVVSQYPVGPYNLDISLVERPLAMEIHGGGFHASGRHAARRPQRLEYLFSRGWSLIEVWNVTPRTWNPVAVAENFIALGNLMRSDPAPHSRHWMILGNAQPAPACRSYGYDAPAVPAAGRRDERSGRYLSVT